jgi:hypothetical protein
MYMMVPVESDGDISTKYGGKDHLAEDELEPKLAFGIRAQVTFNISLSHRRGISWTRSSISRRRCEPRGHKDCPLLTNQDDLKEMCRK